MCKTSFSKDPSTSANPRREVSGDNSRATTYTPRDVVDIFENIAYNPVLCSALSYFCRAETPSNIAEFREIHFQSIIKEIGATQQGDRQQQLNYRGLTTDSREPIQEERFFGSEEVIRRFKEGIYSLEKKLTRDSGIYPIYYPYYNGKKNIGYKTQVEYLVHHGQDPNSAFRNITTLDLIKTYYEEGYLPSGPLEVRTAWRFNDLSPRVYYCLGGDAFRDGLYIKEIVAEFLQLLPSTHPFSRFDVQRIGLISPEEVLITYDYTSFTTSLSELKFFLWYLGTYLQGMKVQVLDVYHGLTSKDLGSMILDYNKAINHHQEFDVSRLEGAYTEGSQDIYWQGLSGSLGVQGNIAFSTLNHGVALGGFTNTPEKDSCVGDDALFKTHFSLCVAALTCVIKLGLMHPDKITVISPPVLNENIKETMENAAFKYLKRPLNVDPEGRILTGFLDDFPNVSLLLFPEGDGVHNAARQDAFGLVKSFCTQWGKYLRRYESTPWFVDEATSADMEFILSMIQAVYSKYGIPLHGGVPGSFSILCNDPEMVLDHFEPVTQRASFFAPSCSDLSVFRQNWVDILLLRNHGKMVVCPLAAGGRCPPPDIVYEGLEFIATGSKLATLLVDLGCWEREQIVIERKFDSEYAQEIKLRIETAESSSVDTLYTYYVRSVPHWYDSVYDATFTVLSGSSEELGNMGMGHVPRSERSMEESIVRI